MKSHGIRRSHSMPPAATLSARERSTPSSAIGSGRPFGLRYLVDPHPSATCDLDLAAVRLDDVTQIAVMSRDSDGVPVFKHTSDETSTTTNIHDRKTSDSDTDYEPDK